MPQAQLQGADQTRAIIFVIIAVTAVALMDTAAKRLGGDVHVSQILWARYAGQMVIMAVFLRTHMRRHIQTDHPKLQILRSLLQMSAAACFFIALKTNGLSEATAVSDLAPVLITLAAAVFLGETVGRRRALGVTVALIGALIIIRPGSDIFSVTALWPLGTAASIAGFAIITRYIGSKEAPTTGLLSTAIIGTFIMSIIAPFHWVTPSPLSITLLICVGALGTFGQLMMMKAFMNAEASAIAPFTYAGLLAATLAGWLFFGDIPDAWSAIGALVIVGAGLYVWSRERYAAKQP
jgi:drug/metabolite transporter (DMT)-like permease